MGTKIHQSSFQDNDFYLFHDLVTKETNTLKKWVKENKLSNGLRKEVGVELEGWLLDEKFQPIHSNLKFIKAIKDQHLVPEVAKSTLEINSDHYWLENRIFSLLYENLQKYIQACYQKADKENKKFIYIGALPAALPENFSCHELTNEHRYYAIDSRMSELRHGDSIHFAIISNNGNEKLILHSPSIAIGGVISALHIHLQVGLKESARYYNTAQIIAAPMLAIAANSLCLLGQPLWSETRVPFFEQLFHIDKVPGKSHTTRAFFGHHYLKESLLELFIENKQCHGAILPYIDLSHEDLFHLQLHNGTIYRWNRPVLGFNQDGQPHFRIEHRFLSAGPTILDMCANVALFIGIVHFFSQQEIPLEAQLEFKKAKYNFYQAAKYGLNCQLHWVNNKIIDASELLLNILLPFAHEGLHQLEIHPEDIKLYLTIIEERIRTLRTASDWQRLFLNKHNSDVKWLTKTYIELQRLGLPVHEWPI